MLQTVNCELDGIEHPICYIVFNPRYQKSVAVVGKWVDSCFIYSVHKTLLVEGWKKDHRKIYRLSDKTGPAHFLIPYVRDTI